jgi:competence protein ComEC
VGEVWDTGEGVARGTGGGYAAWIASARARGAPVKLARDLCGVHAIGGATVEVLAPCPGPRADEGANDNSFVLRITWKNRSILLTGDLERAGERALLAAHPKKLRADVLKVGHHGSRTSTSPELLAAVRPTHAVISCGVRNRFGHPHEVTLRALAGVAIHRTDREGTVTLRTDGGAWR